MGEKNNPGSADRDAWQSQSFEIMGKGLRHTFPYHLRRRWLRRVEDPAFDEL